MSKDYEDLMKKAKDISDKWFADPVNKRAYYISWSAGQCALSDSENRPIEYWLEVAAKAYDEKNK